MQSLVDDEFGEITIRSIGSAKHIKARVATDGRLSVTTPSFVPKFVVKRFIASSRKDLRQLLQTSTPETVYEHGQQIGKSHSLIVRQTDAKKSTITTDKQQIILNLATNSIIESAETQRLVRDTVIKILRIEAKRYLPRRLKFIAEKHEFSYEKVRFSHAGSRWGSCSSNGTISLNIALMKLPFELIDYVLIHELAHTRQMNHSQNFWAEVAAIDPQYKLHRRILKKQTPSI